MTRPNVLIAGCGDVGSRVARRLSAHQWTVYGLRRNVALLPAEVIPVAGDLEADACPDDWPAVPLDYVVYCVAASRHDEAGYRAAYIEGLRHVLSWLVLHGQKPRRLVFVSSSSVYGQEDGAVVDERSPTEPSGFSGRLMLEAEQLALGSSVQATVVRLTGLYGPGRQRLISQVRSGYRVRAEPPLYANRIHVEDAAGLLVHVLMAEQRGQVMDACYLGVDDAPAPLHEVVGWMREQMGVTEWDGEASVRRTGSKRCSNARARALGWVPQYPTYREGYRELI